MTDKTPTAQEKLKALLGEQDTKKKRYGGGRNHIPNGKPFGGRQPGSGRKPKESTIIFRGIREYIDEYFLGVEKVKVTDPISGKSRMVDKPRAVILAEDLFKKGHYGTAIDKDIPAIKEFFDRAIGKSPQPIRGDAEDDTPIRLEHDIGDFLEKSYGDERD